MIKIKDIVWVEREGGNNYWMAFVRDVRFLQLHKSMVVDDNKWYTYCI